MTVRPLQVWAQQCERLAATGWGGGAGLGGSTQQPAVFDALYRPLLAAWAAAPAFGLLKGPTAAHAQGSAPCAAVAAGGAANAAAGAAAGVSTAVAASAGPAGSAATDAAQAAEPAEALPLRRGVAALAALHPMQPQLGNLLVSCEARDNVEFITA